MHTPGTQSTFSARSVVAALTLALAALTTQAGNRPASFDDFDPNDLAVTGSGGFFTLTPETINRINCGCDSCPDNPDELCAQTWTSFTC